VTKKEREAAATRKAAAQKAAATRKANREKAKRSAAAKKGVETRRRKAAERAEAERKAKRSEAAKRGAETRKRKAEEAARKRKPAKKKAPPKKAPPKKAPPKKKRPVKKAPPEAPPKKKRPPAPPVQIFHAGIRYRRRASDFKGGDDLRIEVAIAVERGATLRADQINDVLQLYAQTGVLPPGMKVDVISWQHAEGKKQDAESAGAIEFARREMLGRLASSGRFHVLGGSERAGKPE
jgi:hypothetical protein